MRTFAFLAAVLFLCLGFACQSRGQCRIVNGQMQCSPQSSQSLQGFQGYQSFAPQSYYSQQQQTATVDSRFAASFRGSDGKLYALYTDGFYREQPEAAATKVASANDPHPCGCGCDLTGQCVCRSCNAGTGFPEAKKKVSSAAPVATSVPASIDPSELREVAPDPEMAQFQDKAGNLYYLNREAVKNSKTLMPVGKWVWQASK